MRSSTVIRFSLGEQVIIRFGKRTGKKATIIKVQPADVYEVKAEDGAILFFSAVGIEKDAAPIAKN
jgi:hypothetical protein